MGVLGVFAGLGLEFARQRGADLPWGRLERTEALRLKAGALRPPNGRWCAPPDVAVCVVGYRGGVLLRGAEDKGMRERELTGKVIASPTTPSMVPVVCGVRQSALADLRKRYHAADLSG